MLGFENRIPKRRQDHFLKQLMTQFAAAAVTENDGFVIEDRSRARAENHFR
jgi:hypothetical protein